MNEIGIKSFNKWLIYLLFLFNIANVELLKRPKNDKFYKILLIAPMATRSHKNFFVANVEALAERGHQVTVVSTFKDKKNITNIRDIVIDGQDLTSLHSNPFTYYGNMQVLFDLMTKPSIICSQNLATKEVQDLKKEKFDLIMLSPWCLNDCFLTLIHHFKVPYVFISPNSLFGIMHRMAGTIYFQSLNSDVISSDSHSFSYMDRLKSTLLTLYTDLNFDWFILPRFRTACEETGLCSDDMPSFKDFYGRNSLVIINSVKALENPAQPWLPHVIHAGGIHCRESKKLPKDMEEWVHDSGQEGFIYFSLGSAVVPSNMPERYRDIFVKVFGSLKHKVLWKWDKEIPELPSNVKLSKWLPQQDVLGHSKIRLFITHGGLLSMQEATYHNVPILGMPLYTDQFYNTNGAVYQGWGDKMEWADLDEDLFRSKILSILDNKTMNSVVKDRSIIMKDKLTEPKTEVAYWIEYVIRHNGAKHIMSPVLNLYVWQLYNIDVWLSLSFISLVITVVFLLFIKKMYIKLFKSKPKRD